MCSAIGKGYFILFKLIDQNPNFVHVFMAFFQQLEAFFELVGKSEV